MEKPIVFKNKKRKQLIGILHFPEGKKRFPLVLICHGFGGTKTYRKFVRLARALEKNGIASFRFDFEGCGDSEGRFEDATIKKEVLDFESALKFILRKRNVDENKVAFVGHSMGGVISTCFVAKNQFPAKALVFWAPAFNQKSLFLIWTTKYDLRKWKKQGFRIYKDKKMGIKYLKENENKDYSPLLSQIQAPILIIHGKKDETVPLKFSKELAHKYKAVKKLIVLPKSDHKFEDFCEQEILINKTLKWLKGYLK